jgi:hypothetical protein
MRTKAVLWMVKAAGAWGVTLPPSCADCLEIYGNSNSWNPKDLSRPVKGLFIMLKER